MGKANKIIYITSTRFPTEKAHGLATVKICEAFADNGYEVDIIAPRLWRREAGDVSAYYGVKNNFRIFKIPCIDLMPLQIFDKASFVLQIISFSLFSIPYIVLKYRKNLKNIFFFSHDYIPLYFMTFLPVKIFYDVHHFPGNNFMYKRLMQAAFGFAVQTKWKINELGHTFGIIPEKIIYWPNGTDLVGFNTTKTKEEIRREFGIPLDKYVVMYTGQLFRWKGVDSLIRSIKMLPENILIYIVGGSSQDVAQCKREIRDANDERIVFIPFQPHEKIPFWLTAADVLILPNTGREKVSLYYTSPMKLFEYLAVGRPIIASAIPSIMEILNKDNSVLIKPDDPNALAAGIILVMRDRSLAEGIAENGKNDSKKYTWHARAQKIIDYLERHE